MIKVKYFELYKNGAFPIDLDMAKSDHDFLDNDVCKAFLRRLKVLNKYSTIVIPNRDILRRNSFTKNYTNRKSFSSPEVHYDRIYTKFRVFTGPKKIFRICYS